MSSFATFSGGIIISVVMAAMLVSMTAVVIIFPGSGFRLKAKFPVF